MTVLQETGNIRRKDATTMEASTSSTSVSKEKLADNSFKVVDYRHGHWSQITPDVSNSDSDSDDMAIGGELVLPEDKGAWKMWSLWGHPIMETLKKFKGAIAPVDKEQFLNQVCLQAKSVWPQFKHTFMSTNTTILVVFSAEAEEEDGQLMVEAKEAVFTPEERPGWENDNYYTIRCSGDLAEAFQSHLYGCDILIITGGKKSIRDLNHWADTIFDLTGSDINQPVEILHLAHGSKHSNTGSIGQRLSLVPGGGRLRALQSGKNERIKLKMASMAREVLQTKKESRKSKPASRAVVKGKSAKKFGNPCAGWIVAVIAIIVAFVMFHAVYPIWYPLAYLLKFFGVDMCEYQKK